MKKNRRTVQIRADSGFASIGRVVGWALACLLGLAVAQGAAAAAAPAGLENAACEACHNGKEKIQVKDAKGKEHPLLAIGPDKYAKGGHAKMECVACHKESVDAKAPHQLGSAPKPNCIQCHTDLWKATQEAGTAKEHPRLGVVAQNIDAYKKSAHAKLDKQTGAPRAVCDDCHNTHFFDVPPVDSAARKGAWRLEVPARCAEKCHPDALDDWSDSIHGQTVLKKHDPKGAICIDCHTSHSIVSTASKAFMLGIVQGCGSCHKENLGSYADTYHGQVNKLGYTYTAKCYHCHGSHNILKAHDPNSKATPKHRLAPCRQRPTP